MVPESRKVPFSSSFIDRHGHLFGLYIAVCGMSFQVSICWHVDCEDRLNLTCE